MVVGLVKPDGGDRRCWIDGGDEIDLTARADVCARAQRHRISRARELDLSQTLGRRQYPADLGAERRAARRARAPAPGALEEFGLRAFVDARGDSLSGGERRRVEIARALAIEPAFLLLDEPFTGIDPIAVADIQAMIRQLRDRGLGILITDHQVRETLAIVDRAYIMNNGRIEVSGTAQEVLDSPIARQFYLGEGFRLCNRRTPAARAASIHDSRPYMLDRSWRARSVSAWRISR